MAVRRAEGVVVFDVVEDWEGFLFFEVLVRECG